VRDLFELILRVEPKSMFVAKSDQVVGYAIGLVDMSNLRIQAIAGGDLLKWTRRWWHGEYGVRRFPVRNLVWDKLALLLSPGNLKQQFVRTKGMTGQILSIAVSPEVRGKSIGRSLLQACLTHFTEQEIRRVKLEVRPDNKAALTIYEKEGFVQVGEYKDGRGTWLVMMRDL
jgi:ribosomal-protein-alanine N-acetyltransferase